MTNTTFQRYPTCTCGTPGQCSRVGHVNRTRIAVCAFCDAKHAIPAGDILHACDVCNAHD